MLNDDLADNLDSILGSIVEWTSPSTISSQQSGSLSGSKLVKQILQKRDRFILSCQNPSLVRFLQELPFCEEDGRQGGSCSVIDFGLAIICQLAIEVRVLARLAPSNGNNKPVYTVALVDVVLVIYKYDELQ